MLLFWWVMVGWVLPTLVLLLPGLAQRQRRLLTRSRNTHDGQQSWLSLLQGRLASCSDAVEYMLCGLLTHHTPPVGGEGEALRGLCEAPLDLPAFATLSVRWTTLVFIVWIVCWSIAPLYASPR